MTNGLTDVTVRPFADFLREVHSGRSHDELGEALHDLVARVKDTGKKGTLTYTVIVEPVKGISDDSALTITDEIKLKLPEHDRGASLFWANRDGNLERNNPNQMQFDSLEVVTSPGPDVTVNVETGEIVSGGAR